MPARHHAAGPKTEAMRAKTNESPGIKSKMDDVAEAVAAVKRDLIQVLPKMRRAGRTDVSDLKVSVNAAGLGAPLRRGVSTGGCRGGLLPRCTCAYRPWAGATSCGLPRSSDCVGFCGAFSQEPSFSRRKIRLCVVLLGELIPLSQETARSRRVTQVVLRLVFLAAAEFFGATSCGVLRATTASDYASLFRPNTYGILGRSPTTCRGDHSP